MADFLQKIIFFKEDLIMAAIENLQAAVAKLDENVTAVKAKIDAMEASKGVPEADVQAQADKVVAANAAIEAVVNAAPVAPTPEASPAA